jgi:uncharacterized NAD(P)/FAD-binding protein YdhS
MDKYAKHIVNIIKKHRHKSSENIIKHRQKTWSNIANNMVKSRQKTQSEIVKKTVTIYKRHQIAITELEFGAVGTDVSRRTSWWAREDPGRART